MTKKILFLIFLLAISLSACGRGCGGKSPLEREFEGIAAEAAAEDSAEAEAAYTKAEAFVGRVKKFKNPPKGLLGKARALQRQRAREFARAAARDWNFGVALKVFRALQGSKLDPETEARAVGVPEERLKETSRPPVDPWADQVPPEWK